MTDLLQSARRALGQLVRHLSEPRCPVCRQPLDDCQCDPYWHYL